MSKGKKINKVEINEAALVDLIEKIVTETVSIKKKEWLAEQEKKKASLVESKLNKLEAKIKSLTKK